MARGATRELKVRIKGEDKVSAVFGSVSQSSSKTAGSMQLLSTGVKGVGIAFGAAATAGGVFLAFSTKAVKASAEQATGIAKLDNALKRNGSSYMEAAEGIEEFAAQQQATTRFGDDETRVVLTNLINLTGNYSEDTIKAARAVQDLAEGGQMPMASASRLVSQAIAGNISSLTRYIPSLKGMKAETFAAMDITERTTIVVDALGGAFGGAAEAIDPVTQKMANLRNTSGDVVEAFGDAIREGGAFEVVLDTMLGTLGDLKTMIEDNEDAIRDTFVAAMVAGVGPAQFMLFTIKGLHQAIVTMVQLAQPMMKVLEASAGVVGPVSLMRNAGNIADAWKGVYEQLQNLDNPLNDIDKQYESHAHWLQTIENKLLNVKHTAKTITLPTDNLAGGGGGGGGGGGRPPRKPGGGKGPAKAGGGLEFEQENFAGFGAFDELAGRSASSEDMDKMLAGPGQRMGPPAELAAAQEEAAISSDMLANSAVGLGQALASAAMDSEDATMRITQAVIQMLSKMAAASVAGPLGILLGGGIGIGGSLLGGGGGRSRGVGGRRAGAVQQRQATNAHQARMVRG